MHSYTQLHQFWECPRAFGFQQMGYHPIVLPEPMTTGVLTHAAIASYFRGGDWTKVMAALLTEANEVLDKIPDNVKRTEASEDLITAFGRAQDLTLRYIEQKACDYIPIFVEQEFRHDRVVIHPDLVAYFKENNTIIITDIKTSKSPDLRAYDLSGQVDLYAIVLKRVEALKATLVAYDVISEEGIYRIIRPPRREVGERLYTEIAVLSKELENLNLLDWPHAKWDCPSRCDFFEACYIMDTADERACFDYLNANYLRNLKEEKL